MDVTAGVAPAVGLGPGKRRPSPLRDPQPGDGCAVVSRLLGEPVAGTASPVRSWLLVEQPGAWSRTAREDFFGGALLRTQQRLLQRLWERDALRPLLIRRHGRVAEEERDASSPPTVIVGGAQPGRTWLERVPVDSPRDLAELDLAAVTSGDGGLGEPISGPLLLVCTHGAKDMCCAVSGRPLAAALSGEQGDLVWECSHLGGDRFAGNVAVAPYGFFFGRLSPGVALHVAEAVVSGRLPLDHLDHLRGRSCWSPVGQWAEVEVRRIGGYAGLDEVVVTAVRRDGDHWHVDLDASGRSWHVEVTRRATGARAASRCAAELAPAPLCTVAVAQG